MMASGWGMPVSFITLSDVTSARLTKFPIRRASLGASQSRKEGLTAGMKVGDAGDALAAMEPLPEQNCLGGRIGDCIH